MLYSYFLKWETSKLLSIGHMNIEIIDMKYKLDTIKLKHEIILLNGETHPRLLNDFIPKI